MNTRRPLASLARLLARAGSRTPRPAPARRRAARRTILWGVVAVLVAHLSLATALETVLPQVRDPEYGYRLVRAREQQRLHPTRPLVLVMGSSRTANAVDPSAAGFPDEPGAPLLFNFGLSGEGPLHLRTHLARIRADGVKPDVLLVELFPALLVVDEPPDATFSLSVVKLTVGDLRRLDFDRPVTFHRRWAVQRLNAWHVQRLAIMSHVAPDWLAWRQRLNHYWTRTDRFGFEPYEWHKIDEMREARLADTQSLFAWPVQVLRVGASSDRAIRGLVADCRATGTPIAFFLTPESPTFRSWYTAESRAALATYLRALSAELNCPVFEAPEDYAEEDFGDGHHLLPRAAARFTRHLSERHLKPWLDGVRK
jgi:hypothetical protein